MHYAFHFWTTLILIAVLMGVLQGTCAYLILAERKISAWAQDRIGPNRGGPLGLLQPIADGLKFLFKEEVVPRPRDPLVFLVAPRPLRPAFLPAGARHCYQPRDARLRRGAVRPDRRAAGPRLAADRHPGA